MGSLQKSVARPNEIRKETTHARGNQTLGTNFQDGDPCQPRRSPKAPILSAKVAWNQSGGWVIVERCGDHLYVDNKKVVLHLVGEQKIGSVYGHVLREQLKGQVTLHSNILDALLQNTRFIPKSWKYDVYGRTHIISFWSVGYCDSRGDLCVRDLYWRDGVWDSRYRWLSSLWDVHKPAAVLAS